MIEILFDPLEHGGSLSVFPDRDCRQVRLLITSKDADTNENITNCMFLALDEAEMLASALRLAIHALTGIQDRTGDHT